MERVLEHERYKRRWNLRIREIKEKDGENTREVAANLLVNISPPLDPNINHIVDSAHRLDRQEENKTRQVVIQFTQRIHRDALWKMTKDSSICKELGISFIEDLCKADGETRAAVAEDTTSTSGWETSLLDILKDTESPSKDSGGILDVKTCVCK